MLSTLSELALFILKTGIHMTTFAECSLFLIELNSIQFNQFNSADADKTAEQKWQVVLPIPYWKCTLTVMINDSVFTEQKFQGTQRRLLVIIGTANTRDYCCCLYLQTSITLPSIPRGGFLHIDTLELAHQLLAASPYGLSQLGKRATSPQRAILMPGLVAAARPAGPGVACNDGRGWRKDWMFMTASLD